MCRLCASFYLALEVAKSQSASIATVTAINYASVALILFLSWFFGRQNPDWRNWLGVGLVIAGVFLTSLTPPTAGQPTKSTSADSR
jgi:drug/metabolite transporter (DMT)-like permease